MTQPSHLGGSGPTPSQSTKTLPATWLRRKLRKKTTTKNPPKYTDRQNPRTNGKSKPIQTKSHKEAYTYTPTEREKGKIYIYILKKGRKRATKPINKSTNYNKL